MLSEISQAQKDKYCIFSLKELKRIHDSEESRMVLPEAKCRGSWGIKRNVIGTKLLRYKV